MPLWIQIIAVVIAATIVVVPLLMWFERRAWRRHESWPCPVCGSPFGEQHKRRFWAVHRDPHLPSAPAGGPILRCPSCQRDFAFDDSGRQVDEHREYVKNESRAGVA